MTEKDLEHTGKLLSCFNAESLGDGNLAAGANLLATMALTIANVQRPGSAIVVKADGWRLALGCGFVVSEPLCSSLLSEHVVSPMQLWQGAVCDNVRHYEETVRYEREVAERKGRQADLEPVETHEDRPRLERLFSPSIAGEREDLAKAKQLLIPPPGMGVREIQDHPLIFASAGSPEMIPRLMKSAHLGQLLLHVPLHGPDDVQAYSQSCDRLMDGCILSGPAMRSVCGRVMVVDPHRVLGEAVRISATGAGWWSRLLWLSDHGVGPNFALAADRLQEERLDRVTIRFLTALSNAFGARLNASGNPVGMELDLRKQQAAWVTFLAGCESSFPGITGTLRTLPASLTYGLWRMVNVMTPPPKASKLHAHQVFAFARLLALRMVNLRQVMMHSSRRALIEARGESIRRKLVDGPMTVRALIRRTHRLSTAECEEALDFLAAAGLVRRSGHAWCLTSAATLAEPQTLTLNV